MRLAWLTDIHLDFAQPSIRDTLGATVMAQNPDAIVITGDIATSSTLRDCLFQFYKDTSVPIYFVLGNHDYWGARMDVTHRIVRNLGKPRLKWLTDYEVVRLTPTTALVGMDGWYDLRAGAVYSSTFRMPEFLHLHDLHNLGQDSAFAWMERMADRQTYRLLDKAHEAVKQGASKVILATHVPPFPEACSYRGKPTDQNHLPWYCNALLGKELRVLAHSLPDVEFLVLCGHTHGGVQYQAEPNLLVQAGAVTPTEPTPQPVIEVA